MDYTRDGLEKKEDRLSSPANGLGKQISVFLLQLSLLLLVMLACVGFFGGLGMISGIIANAPDIKDINISPSGYATFIFDADGNQLQKLTTSDSNRISVALEKVPEDLQHAVVAIEDERFYQHTGIDARGIIRALVVGVKNRLQFTEGASTITQQLLKNNVFTNWTSERSLMDRIRRKFQEQYLAVQLEEKLTKELGGKDAAKERILENYLNTINLGAGTYGVQAAARKYFNKDVSELTLSEITVIAGITQNPSKYNPIRHPEYNAERRKRVLNKMLQQNYITETQKEEALADDVYERIIAAQEAGKAAGTVYSYFIDELTEQVVEDLMTQKGYNKSQAYQVLYSGGLRIYTTQDPAVQAICDEEYADPDNFPGEASYSMDWALSVRDKDGTLTHYSREMLRQHFREKEDPEFDFLFDTVAEGERAIARYKKTILKKGDEIIAERSSFAPQPQSSLVVMDQKNGHVLAIVGGRGEKTASLTLNRATNTTRQPGSTFKVLSTYATSIDSGDKTLASVYKDEPYTYANGRPVSNASGQYHGMMTIREAIRDSINVVAVKCVTEIGPEKAYQKLLDFGFTTLSESNDVYQPLALGGIYHGVSNLELTAAYAALANQGVYTKPVFYTRILDENGNTVLDNTAEQHRVVTHYTAALLTAAMEDVVTAGTGTEIRLDTGMPVAGKTGTTTGYNDLWFVGYTPHLTCGIWAGYDSLETLPDEGLYRSYHKQLWQKIMSRLSYGQERRSFAVPSEFVRRTVCQKTGKLAGSNCPAYTEIFVPGTEPGSTCSGYGEHDHEFFSEPTPTPTPTPRPTMTPTITFTPTPTETPTAPPEDAGEAGGQAETPPPAESSQAEENPPPIEGEGSDPSEGADEAA